MNFTAIFLGAFVCFALQADPTVEFKRSDGTQILGYFDRPQEDSFPIAIVLQGSQCASVHSTHEEWKESLLKMGYGLITIEKKGIAGKNILDRKEYEESNSIDQRLNDHLVLLEQMRKGLIPGWNHRIAIIGSSEGGEVGGALAEKAPETTALILFCAGGGWLKMEELMWSFRKQLVDEEFSPQYVQSVLVQSKDQLYRALQNPTSKEQAFGFTYKYWASTLRHRLLDHLLHVHCPIYIVQGGLDDRIPPDSVDYLIKALKDQGKNSVSYRKIETLGHDLRQDPSIYKDALSWLKNLSRKSS